MTGKGKIDEEEDEVVIIEELERGVGERGGDYKNLGIQCSPEIQQLHVGILLWVRRTRRRKRRRS